MAKIIVRVIKIILPIFVGAFGGYMYYEIVGCNNSCAITGNPVISTLYGAAVGAVFINWKDIVNLFGKSEDDKT